MDILLCGEFEHAEREQWAAALAAAWPSGRWLDPAQARARPDTVRAAVVANPPRGSLQGWPRLALIQSLWAGVDRLLADPTLPAGVPLVRMVDPAMNAAMAETALWAALALQRDFFTYARQQAQRARRPTWMRWPPAGRWRIWWTANVVTEPARAQRVPSGPASASRRAGSGPARARAQGASRCRP